MATGKQITNPAQAWTAGATWGNTAADDEMTQVVANLQNNTGVVLYTGDIVCLDATGKLANLPGSTGDSRVIGTVGGGYNIDNTTLSGNYAPFNLQASVAANMGFTNGSATVTFAGAAAVDLGDILFPAFNATTNANPQALTIIAVNPGVGYTVNANFSGTTGTFSTLKQSPPSSIGPGFVPISVYPVGTQVPIVQQGWGRVNVNAQAATVAGDFLEPTNASVVGTRVAQGAATAAQIGQFIAVALQAYAARDTSLTALGITGHDSITAIIGKF